MKTTTKAIFAMAILALAAAIIVVPADASDAADDRTLTIEKIEYEAGMIGVTVDKDVNGKSFIVLIDGVEQAVVGYGSGKVIAIDAASVDTPHEYTLKNADYNDLTFTYPAGEPATEFNVNFVIGGENVKTITVAAGETIAQADIPAVPEIAGKEFKYWALNGEQYDFATPITSSITLVAVYEDIIVPEDKVTVTFMDGETQIGSAQVIDKGAVATEPEQPEKTGYTFQYWALNGEQYDFATPVNEDIVLTAVWKHNFPK